MIKKGSQVCDMKKFGNGKKRSLSTEITILNIGTSVGTLLLLGSVMLLTFFFIFFGNTKDDMEYVLNNINQQFQDHVQFIQDGAVTIRHNVWLEDFFWGASYDEESTKEQLSYSMELFSDRNMVKQQVPFVKSVYLFNNINQCVYEHYYPMTVSSANQKKEHSYQMQQIFKATGKQYYSYRAHDGMIVCFRIYNEKMQNMGICLVEISEEALSLLLEEMEAYRNGSWVITADETDMEMASFGADEIIPLLKIEKNEYVKESILNGTRFLHVSVKSGFGLRIVVAAGMNNIYMLLKPTMFIFIAVLLMALIIATLFSLAMSYRFTKPVRNIIEGLRAFGQEDFSVRMGEYSLQEFQEISVVFNEMADRIEYLIKQVYEKQILATTSQVKFLQAQINPHFQFNILAMLSIKAKMAGNEELYQCLRAFSKLMQGKIFRGKEIKIPVASEMEIVDFYLLLQNSRYEDKISYEIIYGSEKVKEYLIPRLLIEPLVENAVSHGLEPKNGNGKITVQIYENDNRLHILVEDDGVGFDAEELQSASTKTDHTRTGLANTARLLKILYKDSYELDIQGKKGEGTTVRIVLPVEKISDDTVRRDDYVESSGG